MTPVEPGEAPGFEAQRALKIAAYSALCLGVLGFVTGTRQAEGGARRAAAPVASSDGQPATRVPVAVRYEQVGEAGLGPNAGWSTRLDGSAPAPSFAAAPSSPPDLRAKREALATRATRRAYAGAPPVVPHRVEGRSAEGCLVCHADGLRLGDELAAAPLPHALLINCLQCHASPPPAALSLAEGQPGNRFQGLAEPTGGARAWAGAPPVIPHRTAMREQCLACHGVQGTYPALRSTHPWRVNCRQCHASSASFSR